MRCLSTIGLVLITGVSEIIFSPLSVSPQAIIAVMNLVRQLFVSTRTTEQNYLFIAYKMGILRAPILLLKAISQPGRLSDLVFSIGKTQPKVYEDVLYTKTSLRQ